MPSAEVSHGRGGAGNFTVDDTKYEDGSIVRVGDEGSHGDGAYSAGRGGMFLAEEKIILTFSSSLSLFISHGPCFNEIFNWVFFHMRNTSGESLPLMSH